MKPIEKPKAKRISFFRRVLKKTLGYFNVLPDKEKEAATIEEISHGVRFRGANLWVLIFGILIASLGLNINSTAVIIGAMLISPVMGPIIGGGLALGIKDYVLLRHSVNNYILATIISIATATLYFLITPFEGCQSELLARTSPTLYDVLIAFLGGLAGILALSTRGKGNVLPGVAIATALMPPLCTVGYGLATAHWIYALGAFYLFFINTVFIGFATFAGVKFLKFQCLPAVPGKKHKKMGRLIVIGVILSLIPVSIMTYNIVVDALFEKKVLSFIKSQLNQEGTEILSHRVDKERCLLEVVAVGREIKCNMIQKAEDGLSDFNMDGYSLNVVQGEQNDSFLRLSLRFMDMNKMQTIKKDVIRQQNLKISQLSSQLNQYTSIAEFNEVLKPEIQLLFPEVQEICLSVCNSVRMDTINSSLPHILAFVKLRADCVMNSSQREQLSSWLKLRLDNDAIVLHVENSY